jgi:hypothetical protein
VISFPDCGQLLHFGCVLHFGEFLHRREMRLPWAHLSEVIASLTVCVAVFGSGEFLHLGEMRLPWAHLSEVIASLIGCVMAGARQLPNPLSLDPKVKETTRLRCEQRASVDQQVSEDAKPNEICDCDSRRMC